MKDDKGFNEWLTLTVLDYLMEGVIITNNQGLVAYINEVGEKLTGWNRAEALTVRVEEIFRITQGHDNIQESVTLSLKNQAELLTRDGRSLRVEYSTSYISNDNRDVFGQIYFFHDASQYATALENLKQSRRRYKQLVNSIEGIVWEADLKTHQFSFVSKKAEQLLGYPVESWTEKGSFWLNLIPSEDRERILGLRDNYILSDRKYDLEYQVLSSNGRLVWVKDIANTVTDEKTGAEILQGVMFDITDRKVADRWLREAQDQLERRIAERTNDLVKAKEQLEAEILERKSAERKLLEAERKYRMLVERIPGIVYVAEFSRAGKWLYVSPQIETILGYEPAEWQSEVDSWLNHIYPADKERILREEAENQRSKSFVSEYRMLRKNGDLVWIHDEATTVESSLEEPALVQGVMLDITERKLAIEAMDQLEEEFRQSQKLEAIGQLAGGVAHDFNNILMAVFGYCDLLLLKMHATDERRHELHEIRRALEQGASLTRQLLAFSRKQVLETRVLDLNELLTSMESMLRRLIRENIQLEMQLGKNLGRIKGDSGQFQQMILNLSINAVDAMPEGGKLSIETSNAQLTQEYAKQNPGVVPGKYLKLVVSDTGTGMDEETQSRIFEPFFTTKERGKGTGLGLSTVYGIVKQSGGQISVSSERSKGTTFHIFLPQVDQPTEEPAQIIHTGDLPKGSETILLVDDNDAVRTAVSGMLKALGYDVIEACDGEEAMQIVRRFEKSLQLVITDLVMPRMGGLELAEQLGAEHPGLKFLFISGYPESTPQHEQVSSAGAAFLLKPISMDVLLQKVRELLKPTGS
ncbi:PAS domain-containing protein [bacterium]|nr:PAS domain-containing protein [bacterium]